MGQPWGFDLWDVVCCLLTLAFKLDPPASLLGQLGGLSISPERSFSGVKSDHVCPLLKSVPGSHFTQNEGQIPLWGLSGP